MTISVIIEKTEEFEIFPWTKNLETGIDTIDQEHKIIIKLLNKLALALTEEKVVEIENTFNELAQYASFHFESEESIWKKYIKDETLINAHHNSHKSFLPKVLEIKEKNKDKTYHQQIEEILLFLIRWLAFHIIDEDKRLALIIKSLNEGKNITESKYITDEIMSGSMKGLIDTMLSMYDTLSVKAIGLIREKKARIEAEKELKKINIQLERLSITDQLTKLYNRRHFDLTFEKELNKAIRNKTFISLVLFDVDHFKKLNDTYGHTKGDEALIKLAKCLKHSFKRGNDFTFRIGGEEFVILITNDDTKSVLSSIKHLQKKIKELNIPNEKSDASNILTISGGVVSKIPNKSDTVDSLFTLADERLYLAKQRGRNLIKLSD